jgi:sugar phosphate isomerase/epimerase
MKISLNPARLGAGSLSFTEFVDLAARYGFDGIDFSISAAIRAADEMGGAWVLKRYMENKGVAPAAFGLEVEWRRDEITYDDGVAALERQVEYADILDARRCTTWIPPSINADPAAWERNVARRFGEIAQVLEDKGIMLGLEWVGPHHLRAGGENAMGVHNTVHTLPQTLTLIEAIGASNVGLLVDSYHCYTTGIGEAEIARLRPDQIVHVHINDAPPGVGPDAAKDGERVLPGEGGIDLTGFLRGLRATGYDRFVAVEVLAPQDIAADPETAARRVRASLRALGL